MIVSPPNNNFIEQTQQFKQNADSLLTRSAIILRREIEDVKPVVVLGVPAMALTAFYSRNQAFVPKPDDKLVVSILKKAANKTGDIFINAMNSAFSLFKKLSIKSFKFLKDELTDCFSSLSKSTFKGSKKIVKSLFNDGKELIQSIIKF